MSDPYRASICAECGRPHDLPAACRRCGAREGAPLLVKLACYRCALRLAPELAARTCAEILGLLFIAMTLFIGVSLGAIWIPELVGRTHHRLAFDPLLLMSVDVDMAAQALDAELARSSSPPPPSAPPLPAFDAGACSRDLPASAVPHVLAALGPPTSDPKVLLDRASRLASAGFELTIARTNFAPGVLERALAAAAAGPPSVVPVHLNGGVAGVCVEGVGRSGLPRVAGIQPGDVITSVNGVPIVTPELGLFAYESARRAGQAVLEILRGEHRVVLAVTFPELKRGARAPAAARP